MNVTKVDIHKAIDKLSSEQLEMVAAYLENVIKTEEKKKETDLHVESFNYVLNNYSETIKGLVNR